mmetsp:Transcript_58845/g.70806  ORF Transcript_58845/g.70806 Transcript_58845/m.70806 type:complete len:549 (-) Transcript_58845:100-1746(-)
MNKQLIAICIGRVTATFSILGSSLIIYMIVSDRKKKINQPFHRLVLFMSIFDVFQSATMVVANAAFPKESDIYGYRVEDSYGAKGNKHTCAIQSFFMMLGLAVPLYNSCLNIYYVLTIRSNMSSERFAKFEPVMHVIAILVPLSMSIFFTFVARGNIEPQGGCVCGPESSLFILAISSIFAICFLICISSMVCISWTVISQANKMRKYTRFQTNTSTSLRSSRINDEKKDTIKQSLLYASAFITTYFFVILSVFLVKFRDGRSPPFALIILANIFYPLQGFWNFLFYVLPGVKHVMKASSTKSYLEALQDVIFNPLSTKNRRGQTANSTRTAQSVLTPNRSLKLGDNVGLSNISCQSCNLSSEKNTTGRLYDAPKRLHKVTNSCDNSKKKKIKTSSKIHIPKQLHEMMNHCNKSEKGNMDVSFTGLQSENQQAVSSDCLMYMISDNFPLGMASNLADEVYSSSSNIEIVSVKRTQNAIERSNPMALTISPKTLDGENCVTVENREIKSHVKSHSKQKSRRLSSLTRVDSILSPETLSDLNAEYDYDDA